MNSINDAVKTVNRPEKILQFGEGNFLRAFIDWMVDITNEKTDFNGSVVLVQPLDRGLADMINDQKGLYTTVLRGIQDGKAVEDFRAITSVSRCLDPYAQNAEYMKCAENPELRFIISNTTEAGIAYSATDKLDDVPQSSFPGKVTAFLYRRFTHFKGEAAKGLVIIPCELIDKNGDKLREIVLRYADEWKLGNDFTSWVQNSCAFCNSLVDRIVPGYPREEADAICEKIGYKDNLLDAAEIFHLWVIESDKDFSAEFPLAKAGLNVIWTKDMSFYRTRKVRILNGAHTSSVPAAFLYGLDTVESCIKDELIISFMKKAIFEEIIPSMDGNADELRQYAADVLERFANPYIKHMLLSITLNSVSKYKTRVLPSLIGYIKKEKKLPSAITFSLAALIAFYNGTEIANAEMTGNRAGSAYPIKDDLPILERFASLYKEAGSVLADPEAAAKKLAHAVLSTTDWWGEDLTAYAGLESAVAANLASIWSKGMKAAIEEAIKDGTVKG
jgi:tagaturonate reductase